MKISVIVPVYKVEAYLRQCVDSILGQTFSDFELILVDDGSPDGSGAICDEYAAREPRVHVIHQANGGLSAARNAGIDWVFANSDSQWLIFVDSDDWLHPRCLELLERANRENGTAVSVCGFLSTADRSVPVPDVPEEAVKACTPESYWCARPVNATIACCKLYARELFETVRYPIGKLHEDELVTYRLLFSAKTISEVDFPLYYYFQNTGGIMGAAWSPKRLVALDFLPEQIAFFRQNGYPEALACTVRGYAIWCETTIRRLEGEAQYRRYIPRIRRRLKGLLLRNRRLLPFRSWQNKPFYECAYPVFCRVWHAAGRAARKLLRLS